MHNFFRKSILITGASSGIGAALARELSHQGAKVALLARRTDRIVTLASQIEDQGGQALAIRADVTDEKTLAQAVEQVRATWGGIDAVVANAGFGVMGRIENLELADFERQFDTNVWGVLRTLYATLPALKQRRGQFVVIGSVSGYVAMPGTGAYGMSKFAVRALCDSLWHELKPYGVSVTHIAPGFVETEIRQVDNRGVLHAKPAPPAPKLLRVTSEVAAREIARAMAKRRREWVITAGGKIFIWLQRHFPIVMRLLIRVGRLEGRVQAKA